MASLRFHALAVGTGRVTDGVHDFAVFEADVEQVITVAVAFVVEHGMAVTGCADISRRGVGFSTDRCWLAASTY